MGFSNSSFSKSRSTPTSLAEINVVPLIDIMLVLLIVFMISAPLMQQGTQVELPKADTGTLPDLEDQIVLDIDKNKKISINGKAVPKGTLAIRLAAMSESKPGIQAFVRADQSVDYGTVAKVIAEVKRAKIPRVGLVTLPEAQSSDRL